jgi:hypothetical protein
MSAQLLSLEGTARLRQLEAVIERGQRSFVEVGRALRTIRDDKLYDAAYGTFEHYCRARLKMSRRHVYRYVEASEVVDNLCPIGHKLSTDSLPQNESVCRVLAPLPPEQQREVWAEVSAEHRTPTARQVAEAIRLRAGPVPERERRDEPDWYIPLNSWNWRGQARNIAGALSVDELDWLIAELQRLRGKAKPAPGEGHA